MKVLKNVGFEDFDRAVDEDAVADAASGEFAALRVEFENWIIGELRFKYPNVDFSNGSTLLTQDAVGGYSDSQVHERWLGWVAGRGELAVENKALRYGLQRALMLIEMWSSDPKVSANDTFIDLDKIVRSALDAAGGLSGEV